MKMRSKKYRMVIFSSFILLMFISSLNYAQGKGTITGRVLDATDKSPLWGASILVKGTSIGVATEDDGKFKLTQIQSGKVIVMVRYVGYITVEKEVTVLDDKTATVDIILRPTVIEGKEVVVTGQLQGQQAAINQQLSSNSIVNIVSKDKIQELPDQNAAEALARLPGISLQRDGGEGQKVIVRGLSPKYNNITINDEKIPSTDEEDRSVDLSSISPDMLAGIEVYKSLTADKDADAVGGTVNFTVKKASDNFQSDVKFQGGYGSQEKYYGNYRGAFSVSDRFLDNTFGIIATGNIQRANRSSDAQNVAYSFASQTATGALVKVDNLNLVDTKEIRDRYGASLAMDYDLGNGSLFFSGFWSKTDRDEVRRRKRYQITNARTQYEVRKSTINLDLFSANLKGVHTLGLLQLDWSASYSESNQKTPLEFNNIFQELSSLTNQIVINQGPELIPLGVKNDLANTTFKESDITSYAVQDHHFTALLNAKVNFDFGDDIAGYLKFGGKLRWNRRDRDNTQLWTSSFNVDSMGVIAAKYPNTLYRPFALSPGRQILMNNFLSNDDLVGQFLNGAYNFGVSLDQLALDNFLSNMRNAKLQSGKSLYVLNPQTDLQDYNAAENVSAAYAMAEIRLTPKLLLIPGVRFERTYNDYKSITGTPSSGEDSTPDLLGAKDTVGSNSYYDILPMFQLRYRVTDWFDVRASVTKTLSRPNYFNLVPWQEILYLDNTINKGNPNLKHTQVWNYDLFFSFYNQYGLFTLGGFYKKLWDIDYIRQSRIHDGGKYNGFLLIQPVNAETPSTVYGVEIDAQANLTILPSPFDGIVFYANLSIMKSKTSFPYFAIGPRSPLPPFAPTIIDTVRDGTMPGQADYLGNFAIGYEKGGFSGRLSLVFQGKSLSFVGARAELDGFTDQLTRWDLALQQKVFSNISVFLNVNNLSNTPDRSFLGVLNYPTNEEFYGWTLDFGIKYKL
ncbi:MAG: TonB-dependent receptor [Ignavibacteriales bacterium]|nr:TonB-dependent receptor [Ignavibacteriales bacterium]